MRLNEDLELSSEQKKWVSEWCYSNLDNVDFRTAIQKTNGKSFSIKRIAIYLWYFFRKLELNYPKEILLDMISFDYEGYGTEYLEDYLNEAEMSKRVLENLQGGIPIDFI